MKKRRPSGKFSRREWIALVFGGSGAAMACACAGLGVGAYLVAAQNRRKGVPLATSAAYRRDLEKMIALPRVVPRAEWGALEPNHDAENEKGFYSEENPDGWRIYSGELRDIYTTLVIHHSAFYENDDVTTMLEVQKLHRNDRGWADIAYHYLVGKEGAIYEGRPVGVRGTHVAGYNTGSLGVCLLGNFMVDLPTPPQLQAATLLGQWMAAYLHLAYLAGHRQFNPTTLCPGDNLIPYLTDLAENLWLTLSTEGYNGAAPADTSYFRGCDCQV